MIDRQTAAGLAAARIRQLGFGEDVVIDEARVIERPFGWLFPYNTRAYVATRDLRHALVGNAPIIVDRDDGSVHETGTARPAAYYIEQYEAHRGQFR